MRLCTWFAGIDLDSRCLTATLGFSSGDQTPRILGSKVFEAQSYDVRTPSFQDVLRSNLPDVGKWFHLETGGTLTHVAVAVPGSVIHELPSSGVSRYDGPTLIDPGAIELTRQRALAGPGQLGAVLSSVIRGYELDDRHESTLPVGTFAKSLRVEVTSWVARPAIVQPLVDAVNDIGFDVGLIVPRAVAGAESTLTPAERRDGATLVVIGDDMTECATFVDSSLVDVFSVPLGRKPLVKQLARACNVSVEVVNRLDLGLMVDRVPADPIVKRVRTVLSAWGTALFEPIRRRLEERDIAWRLQAGIVIANAANAFPTLDERAARVMGTPARFAAVSQLFERVSGGSCGSFAALGLIPLQWSTSQEEPTVMEDRQSAPVVSSVINVAQPAGRGGIGHAIGRWLREFVPADHLTV